LNAPPLDAENGGEQPPPPEIDVLYLTTDYCGNIIYENNALKYILNPEGYAYQTGNGYHYDYYLRDHLGNNWKVGDQVNNYYPSGMTNLYISFNSERQPYKFGGKELDEMHGLNWYDQGARPFDAIIPRTPTIDPMAEKYYNTSPYVQYANNPVRFVDPDGKVTYVTSNQDGTFTVVGGQLDGDKSIYVLFGENKLMGFLGESLTEYSFFETDGREAGTPVVGAIIDPNDHSGEIFLNTEIIGANPGLLEYAWNARSKKVLDFKDRGINDRQKGMSNTQYRYRGMPLNGVPSVVGNRGDYGLKIYGSARDVGNIAAGYVAGRNGLIWEEARLGFDIYEMVFHFTLKPEGLPTQQAQRIGWANGYAMYWRNQIGK
jgi:RHS repeat-associated protein